MSGRTGPDIDAFLRDLTEISRRHGLAIHGCGCCGSPRIVALPAEEAVGGYTCEPFEPGPDELVPWSDEDVLATRLWWQR